MLRRAVLLGAVAVALAASGCTETGTPTPGSAAVTTSPGVTLNPEQENNRRIVERLAELGCTTNSCIQTYFACKDGYLTGDACEFYRRHPQ
ncbi:UBA domain-containing protein [Nocardia farcinica]|uniref:hypothetical protein n=1 Tax=Nocardia farcinica TaxID=37329 RepID=UPI001895C0ED|nr:hypothetical protein [Nocardia farcinica]MBF6292520.1 hypothetical protein [Nocardia farcinica]MBF6379366.1 hypothetical protein [Nocardia farcinica]